MDLLDKIKIVIAEGDTNFSEVVEKQIQRHLVKAESNLHFEISRYNLAQTCLDKIEKDTDILLLDYNLLHADPESSGTTFYALRDFVKIIFSFCIDCKIIILCDRKNEELVIELFKMGIYECIEKNGRTIETISSALKGAIKEKIIAYYI